MNRYISKINALQFTGTAESASDISTYLNGSVVSINDNGDLVLPQNHIVPNSSWIGFNQATRVATVIPDALFQTLFAVEQDPWEGQQDLVEKQTFHVAVRASIAGRLIRRKAWPDGTFVVAQVPSTVPTEIIPKMSSLPADAKAVFIHRGKPIHYSDQYVIVDARNEICGWVPGHSDMANEDWQVLPVSDFDMPAAPVSETAGTAIPDPPCD